MEKAEMMEACSSLFRLELMAAESEELREV